MHFITLDPTLNLETFNSLICELQEAVTPENKNIHHLLLHINSLLQQAVLNIRAVASSQVQPAMSFDGEKTAPGKNLEHQWRFHKTTRDPGRKKKGLVLGYLGVNSISISLIFLIIQDMQTMKRKGRFLVTLVTQNQ